MLPSRQLFSQRLNRRGFFSAAFDAASSCTTKTGSSKSKPFWKYCSFIYCWKHWNCVHKLQVQWLCCFPATNVKFLSSLCYFGSGKFSSISVYLLRPKQSIRRSCFFVSTRKRNTRLHKKLREKRQGERSNRFRINSSDADRFRCGFWGGESRVDQKTCPCSIQW